MAPGLRSSSLPGCCRSPLAGTAQLCDHSTEIFPLVQNLLWPLIPAHFSQSPSLFPPQVQLFPQCCSGQSHRGAFQPPSLFPDNHNLSCCSPFTVSSSCSPRTASPGHLDSCRRTGTLRCWDKLCSSPATTIHLIPPSLWPPGACRHRPSVPPSLTPHIPPCPHARAGSRPRCPSPLQACSCPRLGQEPWEGWQSRRARCSPAQQDAIELKNITLGT